MDLLLRDAQWYESVPNMEGRSLRIANENP